MVTWPVWNVGMNGWPALCSAAVKELMGRTMVRVKQWVHNNQLSYLVQEPVSRHCALIDPLPELDEEYLKVIRMRGLHCQYILLTKNHNLITGISGEIITPESVVENNVLPMGETHIERFQNTSSTLASYVCDARLFSGDWFLPFSLRQSNAGKGKAECTMMPFVNFPDDYIVYPGRVVNGIRISVIAQEKAMAAEQSEEQGEKECHHD